MIKNLISLIILFAFTSAGFCSGVTSYDKNGNRTGTFRFDQYATITGYDKNGRRMGTFKKDVSGRLIQYDEKGNRVGTFR